ncbi:hypothetical protein TNCV_3317151 [Trichonephila clavipes]|nr:hypothetical protein TNCV_3317151 [Trichonephila clavipes]
MALSAVSPVVGFLSFEFDDNPLLGLKKVAIANLNSSVTILCDPNWLNELRLHVENLKITELYVQNTFHFKFVEPFIPDGIVCHSYRKQRLNRCKSCKKFSCANVKITDCTKQLYNLDLDIKCE